MPARTPRNAPRPPKPRNAKSTNQKRQMMPVFESDDEDSIELFDLDGEDGKDVGLHSEDEENVNPNVSNKRKTKGSKTQRGGETQAQSTRKSGRRRVSSTWQIAMLRFINSVNIIRINFYSSMCNLYFYGLGCFLRINLTGNKAFLTDPFYHFLVLFVTAAGDAKQRV